MNTDSPMCWSIFFIFRFIAQIVLRFAVDAMEEVREINSQQFQHYCPHCEYQDTDGFFSDNVESLV